MNEKNVKWKQIYREDITLSTSVKIKTLLFADDQIIIADTEDNLWRGVFSLQNTTKNFCMEMSSEKSETMALLGQDPVRRNSLWITNVYNK
jgi:hypothetical protein